MGVEKMSGTEAVHCDTGVVDDKVNTITMGLLQMIREGLDATTICNVQLMVLDLSEPAVRFQRLGLLQLCILFQILQGSFSSTLIASGEVDQKGAVVKRRFGILEGQLADYGKSNALRMLVKRRKDWIHAYLVRAGYDSYSAV
jgi:hypothetical protein